MQLLNEVEKIAYRNESVYLPFDTFTAAAFLFPNKMIVAQNQYNATMELSGRYTRGQMIVNRQSKEYNVKIIETISENTFQKLMLWAADYETYE